MRIGPVLWRYCHILRHDGMDYGQYLDQITYLLFLKMWDGGGEGNPPWKKLEDSSPSKIISVFETALSTLARRGDRVGAIFDGSRSEFRSGESLARLVGLINELRWDELDVDVQADAFEYLLEQAAAEGKKGAGQYFTPRKLMRTIVDCVKPGYFASDLVVVDPAAGTGGFLIAAHEWKTKRSPRTRLAYWGQELVLRPRRLALMNATLHGVHDFELILGDALVDPIPVAADVVLANPPFGSQGSRSIDRPDFWFRTANKQANFLQQIVLALAPGGRAAVVIPDNCLFGDIAKGLLPGFFDRATLHTVLRLPDGTFSPYTSGTRTNVLFFSAGKHTGPTWLYDARTGRAPGRRPLDDGELDEFVVCYGGDPVNMTSRREDDSASGRWNSFDLEDIVKVDYAIDQLPWRARPIEAPLTDDLEPLHSARTELNNALKELDKLLEALSIE